MGAGEITESRIDAALQRLEKVVDTLSDRPSQGALNMEDGSVAQAELDSLRVENQLLRQELLELTEGYNTLKQKTETVSGRLDKTIDEISTILE
ncbi:MAG: DUF4164 family protein [Sneathiella sp.]